MGRHMSRYHPSYPDYQDHLLITAKLTEDNYCYLEYYKNPISNLINADFHRPSALCLLFNKFY